MVASPVEGPLEEELPGGLGEVVAALVGLQHLVDHTLQPHGPLLQGVLALQRLLEVLLQLVHHPVLTLTHPGGLLLQCKENVTPLLICTLYIMYCIMFDK